MFERTFSEVDEWPRHEQEKILARFFPPPGASLAGVRAPDVDAKMEIIGDVYLWWVHVKDLDIQVRSDQPVRVVFRHCDIQRLRIEVYVAPEAKVEFSWGHCGYLDLVVWEGCETRNARATVEYSGVESYFSQFEQNIFSTCQLGPSATWPFPLGDGEELKNCRCIGEVKVSGLAWQGVALKVP